MTTKKKYKVIFLDFDGVINGSGPVRYILWKIFKFLKLEKIKIFSLILENSIHLNIV